MSESLRWKLCLGCLLLVALEAPQAGLLVLEDLSGPYSTHAPLVAAIRAESPRATSARVAAVERPVMNAGLLAFGLHEFAAQSAPFAISNPTLSERGNDFDTDGERAGWFVPGSR